MKKSYKGKISLPPGIEFDVYWEDDDKVDMGAVKLFVSKLKRPGWYKSDDASKDTRAYMLDHPGEFSSKIANTTDPFRNTTRVEWYCSQCQWGTTYGGIDIGHKVDWKTELISAGVLSNAEAKAVYNNLVNLRLECATCNRSHDWED
jgi:HNH/ENDO VII superfamily nuclease